MRDVDKELQRAVAASDEAAPVASPVQPVFAPPRRKGNLGLLIGLLVMAGAILTLVFTSFKGSAVYSKGVDELIREKDKYSDRAVRVQGVLVKGTLVHRDSPCEYRFDLQSNHVVLPVRFAQCIVPDTFR